MSLCLLDQRLGSKSTPDSSSHKFSLKGRQAGGMHRGHSWVFRAESYDTMLAWYNDIASLTEKTGAERNAFVRRHVKNTNDARRPASASSDGLGEDEADSVPFSAHDTQHQQEQHTEDESALSQSAAPVEDAEGGRRSCKSTLIIAKANYLLPCSSASCSNRVRRKHSYYRSIDNDDVWSSCYSAFSWWRSDQNSIMATPELLIAAALRREFGVAQL